MPVAKRENPIHKPESKNKNNIITIIIKSKIGSDII